MVEKKVGNQVPDTYASQNRNRSLFTYGILVSGGCQTGQVVDR